MKPLFILFAFFILSTSLAPTTYAQAPSDQAGIETEAARAAKSGFIPLVGIPYVKEGEIDSLGDYVDALYKASISIAASVVASAP